MKIDFNIAVECQFFILVISIVWNGLEKQKMGGWYLASSEMRRLI